MATVWRGWYRVRSRSLCPESGSSESGARRSPGLANPTSSYPALLGGDSGLSPSSELGTPLAIAISPSVAIGLHKTARSTLQIKTILSFPSSINLVIRTSSTPSSVEPGLITITMAPHAEETMPRVAEAAKIDKSAQVQKNGIASEGPDPEPDNGVATAMSKNNVVPSTMKYVRERTFVPHQLTTQDHLNSTTLTKSATTSKAAWPPPSESLANTDLTRE